GAFLAAPAVEADREANERNRAGLHHPGSCDHLFYQPAQMASDLHRTGVLLDSPIHHTQRVSIRSAHALLLLHLLGGHVAPGTPRREDGDNEDSRRNWRRTTECGPPLRGVDGLSAMPVH